MALVDGTTTAWDSTSNINLNTSRATGMEMGDDASKLAMHSTNVSVYSNNARVGFIQSFQVSEQRTITPIQELGSEGVVQMVPSNTNGGSITVNRFAVYNANLFNALGMTPTGHFTLRDDQISDPATKKNDLGTYGNPFKNLKDQRVPLEIKAKTVMPTGQTMTYYVETYIDCWMERYGKTIQTQTITVTETATIQYSDVMAAVIADS